MISSGAVLKWWRKPTAGCERRKSRIFLPRSSTSCSSPVICQTDATMYIEASGAGYTSRHKCYDTCRSNAFEVSDRSNLDVPVPCRMQVERGGQEARRQVEQWYGKRTDDRRVQRRRQASLERASPDRAD